MALGAPGGGDPVDPFGADDGRLDRAPQRAFSRATGSRPARSGESRSSLAAALRIALANLGLERLDVIHAGNETYALAPRVRALACSRLLSDLPPLG